MSRKLNVTRITQFVESCNGTLLSSPSNIVDVVQIRCSCGTCFGVRVKQLYTLQRKETTISCGCTYKKWTNKTIDDYIVDHSIIRLSDCDINGVRPSKDSIKWKCSNCNHVWQTTVDNVINKKSGCPKCSGNLPYTVDSLNRKLEENERTDIAAIDIIPGKLKTSNSKRKYRMGVFRCIRCDNKWQANIHNVLKFRYGCPKCNANISTPVVVNGQHFHSKLEYYFYYNYKKTNIGYQINRQHKYSPNRRLTCDYYIPDLKVWIEISGGVLLAKDTYRNTITEKNAIVDSLNEQFVVLSTVTEIDNFIKHLKEITNEC